MESIDWTSDWCAFVASVSRAWNSGFSDALVTELHSGRRVKWEGVIKKVFDDGDIAVDMPVVNFQLSDGRKGTASHIVLKIAPQCRQEWIGAKAGDRIIFESEIEVPSPNNPFKDAGVEWHEFRGEGYISLSTRNSRLIEILKP